MPSIRKNLYIKRGNYASEECPSRILRLVPMLVINPNYVADEGTSSYYDKQVGSPFILENPETLYDTNLYEEIIERLPIDDVYSSITKDFPINISTSIPNAYYITDLVQIYKCEEFKHKYFLQETVKIYARSSIDPIAIRSWVQQLATADYILPSLSVYVTCEQKQMIIQSIVKEGVNCNSSEAMLPVTVAQQAKRISEAVQGRS